MPDQSANLAALRASNHALRAYLSVYRGAEVFSATVDNTPADQAKTLVVTTVSGDSADVKAGYRVDVYSSGGDFKGRTRVRYAGTISATSLPIREHSAGIAKIVSGDVVRVYADVRLSDKLVSATLDFAPDDIAYSDQGSNPPPLACSGGAWAGWDDMTPIPFTGSASDYVDPDSNGPLSHAWSFPAGLTADDDDVADVNITAADAGEYLVAHTVTDDDNSKSTVQYVPLIVHDAANPPYEIVVEDVNGDEENGHSFSVRVFDDAALTDIPDGAFCVLWVEQWVNGTRQAFGAKSSGRSHILGVGYIRREEGSFDADSGVEGLRFEVISPMARLAELVGYSKVMTSEATPDSWDDVKSLSTERGIRQLWQFYSNATEAGFDLVTDASYVSYTYPQFFIQKSNPLAQMRELADGTDARLTCDRTGRFSLHTKPELLAVGSRAAATKTITLTTADIIDWQYTREHWRPVELLEARGFIGGSSATPIFSRWPGLAPGQGNQSVTVERLIAASQTNLNERCGRRGAAADGIYTDANGVLQTALDLELTLPGSYHVADFYDEYIAVSLTTALRGLDLSDHLFVLRSSRLELADDGSAQCVWTLRTATNGAAGVTYIPPSDPTSDYDFNLDFYLPPFSYEFTPNPLIDLNAPYPVELVAGLGSGTAKVYYGTEFDASTGAVNWALRDTDLTGDVIAMKSDPFDYRRWFILTTTGLWRNDNLPADAAWTQVADNATLTGDANVPAYHIDMSLARRGYIGITYGRNGVLRSFDYGASFAASTMDGAAVQLLGAHDALSCHMCVSQQDNGVIWGGHVSADPYSIVYLRVSTDDGATWTNKATLTGWDTARTGPVLNVPYMRTPGVPNKAGNSQWVYYNHGRVWGGEPSRLGMTQDGGATWSALTREDAFAPEYIGAPSKYGLHTYTQDGRIVTYWRNNGNYRQLYASEDALTTRGIINGSIYTTMFTATRMGINGWPSNPYFLIIFSSGGVYFTPDYRTDAWISLATGLANTDVVYCAGDLSSFISAS